MSTAPLRFREDKCPICGGRFTDGVCRNSGCALGQFTHYIYKNDSGTTKDVSAVEGVLDAKTNDDGEITL